MSCGREEHVRIAAASATDDVAGATDGKKASAKKKRKSLKRQRASSAGDEGAMVVAVAPPTPASFGLAQAKAALDFVRGAPTSVATVMAAADLLHRLRSSQRFAVADGPGGAGAGVDDEVVAFFEGNGSQTRRRSGDGLAGDITRKSMSCVMTPG